MEASGFEKMVTEISNKSAELLKDQAKVDLEKILADNNFEQLSVSERVTLLRTLINEKAATIEGTDIPADNNNRYVVEGLASLLSVEEIREELQQVQTGMQI